MDALIAVVVFIHPNSSSYSSYSFSYSPSSVTWSVTSSPSSPFYLLSFFGRYSSASAPFSFSSCRRLRLGFKSTFRSRLEFGLPPVSTPISPPFPKRSVSIRFFFSFSFLLHCVSSFQVSTSFNSSLLIYQFRRFGFGLGFKAPFSG